MGQDEVVARLERILANVTRTEPGTATPPVTNSFTPHSDHVSRHMKSVTNRGGGGLTPRHIWGSTVPLTACAHELVFFERCVLWIPRLKLCEMVAKVENWATTRVNLQR